MSGAVARGVWFAIDDCVVVGAASYGEPPEFISAFAALSLVWAEHQLVLVNAPSSQTERLKAMFRSLETGEQLSETELRLRR